MFKFIFPLCNIHTYLKNNWQSVSKPHVYSACQQYLYIWIHELFASTLPILGMEGRGANKERPLTCTSSIFPYPLKLITPSSMHLLQPSWMLAYLWICMALLIVRKLSFIISFKYLAQCFAHHVLRMFVVKHLQARQTNVFLKLGLRISRLKKFQLLVPLKQQIFVFLLLHTTYPMEVGSNLLLPLRPLFS